MPAGVRTARERDDRNRGGRRWTIYISSKLTDARGDLQGRRKKTNLRKGKIRALTRRGEKGRPEKGDRVNPDPSREKGQRGRISWSITARPCARALTDHKKPRSGETSEKAQKKNLTARNKPPKGRRREGRKTKSKFGDVTN